MSQHFDVTADGEDRNHTSWGSFGFLSYRVVQTKARRNGYVVGNLFIPKSKLKGVRREV